MAAPSMGRSAKLNVQTFPRPPVAEPSPHHIQIKWHGQLIADCTPGTAYWVLEMGHPPTYYFPPQSVRMPLSTTPRTTFDEFRGAATYYSMMSPISAAETINNRIWSYNEPPKEYEAIKGLLAFSCGPWECYVNGERAHPHPGDYSGGWVTSDVEGMIKTHPQQPQHPMQQQQQQWQPQPWDHQAGGY
ncbi:hypothetical protein B0H63DRAFT_453547 [Podospora didyma]|uniref:DUF427 domain-containing protein n=1 Tax=Podospora didyma TaxID=330526 RepID=A0AAE0KA58_9PEZI|nr:hypothetical protein B0H63DRAFT_453547 [Podospora didyma]